MSQHINDVWEYLKDNDAPNWFVIFFSLVVWPIVLFSWTKRKRQSIPLFLVTFTRTNTTIGQERYPSILLSFINQTGSITYLYHARLTENQKHFPVPAAASRDMARGWRELVLALPEDDQEETGLRFEHYECVLQTDLKSGRAFASIAVTRPMDDAFYSYRPALLRRWFRCPKYFLLEYDVVVGEKKFSVATVY
jgi:hypothetical protein